MKLRNTIFLSTALISSGCALGLVRVPGNIYDVSNGTVISVEFVVAALGGGGEIFGDNPKTGEHFTGTFAATMEGADNVGIGTGIGSAYSGGDSAAVITTGLSSSTSMSLTMDTTVFMVGNKGTVLDCKVITQRGFRPRGAGECTDNANKRYRLIF